MSINPYEAPQTKNEPLSAHESPSFLEKAALWGPFIIALPAVVMVVVLVLTICAMIVAALIGGMAPPIN